MRNRAMLAALVIPALAAAALPPFTVATGSRVWVQGTSTARSYRCESTQVDGAAEGTSLDLTAAREVSGARISIPVASLDCRNGTMNGHMRTALKATQAPTISFRASSVNLTPGDAGASARMSGNLSIAGETRPVTIDATVVSEDGQLRVRGSKQIDMTEWGVRPPSLMLGTMRVHPSVTVGFDVLMRP